MNRFDPLSCSLIQALAFALSTHRFSFSSFRSLAIFPLSSSILALRTINAAIGRGVNKEDVEKFKNGLLYPELAGSPDFLNIFNCSSVKRTVPFHISPLFSAISTI